MAMNTRKVVVGGLIGGVVLNIIDYVSNVLIFGNQMRADANAFKPGLGDQLASMESSQVITYVITDFVIGLLLVFMYAAVRPRLGAGPGTAVTVAFVFWIFGTLVALGYKIMGVMSSGLWWQFGMVWLVALVLTALVGAKIYSEETAPA